MLAITGNLGFVRQETERQRLGRIKAEASRKVNQIVKASRRLEAEILDYAEADDEAIGRWYLVRTLPGNDIKGMHWLAWRKFGVFRPEQQRKSAKFEGQTIGAREPTFPGWLFVYCLDLRMRDRILACPGIHSLFCYPGTITPVPISQRFIDDLRQRAEDYNERLGHIGQTANHNGVKPPRAPKLGKKERKTLDKIKKALKQRDIFEQSTWDRLAQLAPAQRIALLLRSLQGSVVEGGALASA